MTVVFIACRTGRESPGVWEELKIVTVILSVELKRNIGLPWVRMRGSSVVHRFRGSGGGTRGGCREDVMRALLKRFCERLISARTCCTWGSSY